MTDLEKAILAKLDEMKTPEARVEEALEAIRQRLIDLGAAPVFHLECGAQFGPPAPIANATV